MLNMPPAFAVPLKVPVPFPLSVNVTPPGRAPLSDRLGAGVPVAVTVKEPALPAWNVVLLALEIVGAMPEIGAEISATNTPHDPEEHLEHAVWNAPVVVGNAEEFVEPVTKVLFELSKAMPVAPLVWPPLEPLRNVENRSVEAVGSRTLMKAS